MDENIQMDLVAIDLREWRKGFRWAASIIYKNFTEIEMDGTILKN